MTSINIYQVFSRLFRNDDGRNQPNGSIGENGCSKFNHFTHTALQALKNAGYTHIWFTGVIRHASCTAYPEANIKADHPSIVKGKAGSPYAIKDYYDVAPDLAENVNNRMAEFEQLVKRCHENELKVIIDFVPNHVSRAYHGAARPSDIPDLGENDDHSTAFSYANNFYYIPEEKLQLPDNTNEHTEYPFYESPAKATGNNVFHANPSPDDWYETVKLNYGVDYNDFAKSYFDPPPSTWHRMYEILQFWSDKGIDGFRVDMAEMVPVEFWQWAISRIKTEYAHIVFIAEIYNPGTYRKYIEQGKFDWLYDKEEFYNTMRGIITGEAPVSDIPQIWQAQEGLEHHMLRFMENHDEQRLASYFFAQQAEKALPAVFLAGTMHKGPFMVYFGQELGEPGMDAEGFSGKDGKTSIFDYWRVAKYQRWVNNGRFDTQHLEKHEIRLQNWYQALLQLRQKYDVFENGNFYDLMWINQHTDTHHFYAFIRHNANHKLLIAINFHPENSISHQLKITEHVWENIGAENAYETIEGHVVWGKHPGINITRKSLAENGTELKMQPLDILVFNLETASSASYIST